MKFPIYFSITLVLLVIGFTAEILSPEGSLPEIFDNGLLVAFMISIFLLMLALYTVNKAMEAIAKMNSPEPEMIEEEEEEEDEDFGAVILQKLTDAKPVEEEADIMLDHNYDGIMELDNNLPPWWKWGFYISIVAGVIYIFNYHVLGTGDLQVAEYERKVAEAELEVQEYLKSAANRVDEGSVTLLTDNVALESGKALFVTNCVSCHRNDAGGIDGLGPNLTDEYWLHGGGIVNVFKTVKYGVPGKSMIAWQDQLNPREMQEVASYVLSLEGTNPPAPKEPEGEIWIPEAEAVMDSTQADTINTDLEAL